MLKREQLLDAISVLRHAKPGSTVASLMEDISKACGVEVGYDVFRMDMHRNGFGAPSSYIKGSEDKETEPTVDPSVKKLVKFAKNGIAFDELCDKMDLPPKAVRKLIHEAKSSGYIVDIAGNSVGWKDPSQKDDRTINAGVAPVVDGRHVFAAIGDTHFGSKYCMRQQIADFIGHAYEAGARHILHTGDMLDGCYRHGQWELSHHSFDEQCEDAIETLPVFYGLSYYFIPGNHDETFQRESGMDVGRAIEDRFMASGRDDVHSLHARGARLLLGKVKVELWHPKKGPAYSLSYHMQKHISSYPVGAKPDILLAGHWHFFCSLEQRGVHAIATPCFQGGGSAYGKSLGGAPSIGGVLLSWEATKHGTLRRFSVEQSAYYERECYRAVE